MLPPREWTQASGTWMQYVDKSPADRDAVLRLQRKLDELLNDRQARVSGMCEVRAYLYRQACDELVRHVALDCPERGLLLLRARDERRMALDAWGCVFDESMGFGLRKAVESEPGAGEARDRAEALRSGNDALKRQIAELQKQAAVSAKRDAATAEADDKRRKNEIEGYKFQGISLDALLRKLSAAPPAMPQNLL
ncbi:axonemal dynein light chain [Pelagophyceae sp. CCMP2097]|nr:axonemal dynein light chain [Pelagophyceae sp. CCMP2097]